jgi:HlyD family secretion protein
VYITLRTRENALRVPNAALRFVPQGEREAQPARPQHTEPRGTKTVYRLEQGKHLVPVRIRTGLSDGNYTEVVSGELKAGDTIVVRQARTERRPETSGPLFRFRL